MIQLHEHIIEKNAFLFEGIYAAKRLIPHNGSVTKQPLLEHAAVIRKIQIPIGQTLVYAPLGKIWDAIRYAGGEARFFMRSDLSYEV
jgi:hypothetical protein